MAGLATTKPSEPARKSRLAALYMCILSASFLERTAALPEAPVTDLKPLLNLTDDELYAIFTQGDAVIPAQRAPGRYTTCAGETLINAFTAGDSNYPKGTFPGGYASPLNNFFQRIWYGKIFYTDPQTNFTSLYNMILSNATMSYYAGVNISDPGLSPDGKASVILDYGLSEIVPARVVRDELRRVGPGYYLGRTWITDIPRNYGKFKDKVNAIPETIHEAAVNSTLNYLLNALGLWGPGSNASYPRTPRNMLPEGTTEVPLGTPVPILYFALHCGNPTNQLSYTPLSLAAQVTNQWDGFTEVGTVLPPLNPVQEVGAANDIATEAAFKSSYDLPPLEVQPFNPLDQGTFGTGLSVPNPLPFIKLPSAQELIQAEEAASNPKLPVVSMATPYLPLAQPGALASVAPQVHAGLAQLPESFVHPSLPAATEWAAKLSEFLVEKAFGRDKPAIKEGLKPTGASGGFTFRG